MLAFVENPGIKGAMDLIDYPLTRAQFEDFDPAIVSLLCTATQTDLREWSARLLEAAAAGDAEAAGRARHALKGLCGNYGAQPLIDLSVQPLREADARAHFQACLEATIAAILSAAETRPTRWL